MLLEDNKRQEYILIMCGKVCYCCTVIGDVMNVERTSVMKFNAVQVQCYHVDIDYVLKSVLLPCQMSQCMKQSIYFCTLDMS
mmetsp:Transcript_31895/g.53325  ORF Transcript_31895/g.53325 Transcript_31895/m.53325 type:complete len:82 (-) Transcript_31895:1712-1957(-)